MPVIIEEYPKWIERDGKPFQVFSEEEEYAADDDEVKDRIVAEIKADHNLDVDLRRYEGPPGLPALEAYQKQLDDALIANSATSKKAPGKKATA